MYQHGELLLDMSAGTMGKYDPCAVKPDTLFNVFSVTKIFPALALMVLVDDGLIKIKDKVSDHWPEFAAQVCSNEIHSKQLITKLR